MQTLERPEVQHGSWELDGGLIWTANRGGSQAGESSFAGFGKTILLRGDRFLYIAIRRGRARGQTSSPDAAANPLGSPVTIRRQSCGNPVEIRRHPWPLSV